jgi:hypothetical protein
MQVGQPAWVFSKQKPGIKPGVVAWHHDHLFAFGHGFVIRESSFSAASIAVIRLGSIPRLSGSGRLELS